MSPFTLSGEEEQFASFYGALLKNRWGPDSHPTQIYAHSSAQWPVFAATFPHLAFLLYRLKGIYDNLGVELKILFDKQKGMELSSPPPPPPPPMFCGPGPGPVPIPVYGAVQRTNHGGIVSPEFGHMMDPFEFFQSRGVDATYRNVFMELFVCLGDDREGPFNQFRPTALWREMGRSILDSGYEAERAALVEELSSEVTTRALNAVAVSSAMPSAGGIAIWEVRRQVVVREVAMRRAMARLRVLLEEEEWERVGESQWQRQRERDVVGVRTRRPRARSPEVVYRRDRFGDRAWSRSPSPVRGLGRRRHVVVEEEAEEEPLPIRERRRQRSPVEESDGDDSVEIIGDEVLLEEEEV